jgi:hypothetical protein
MLRGFFNTMIRGFRRSQTQQAPRTPTRFTPGLEALDAREVPAVFGTFSTFAHATAPAAVALNFELENVLVSSYQTQASR